MSEAQSFEKPGFGRNLWLAGLGAFAQVEEGGRDLFDRLVERGRPLEERQKKTLEKVGDKTSETVRDLGRLVQDTVEFEAQGALKRLGLLTRDDVRMLAARLETLAQKIDDLSARRETAAPLLITEFSSSSVTAPAEPAAVSAPQKGRRPRQRKQ
jgi:poly(hydroxyalkanoate) granule-associated protein